MEPEKLRQTGLDPNRIPVHIAVIMDGNGRWAKKRFMPRVAGHRAGLESVRAAVKTCDQLGVRYLTLYAFSTENWSRPKDEVSALMGLLVEFLRKEVAELNEKNVRLRAIGRVDGLPVQAREELQRSIEQLNDNSGLTLCLALNYGGRSEIVNAVREAVRSGISWESVDESVISSYLYTGSRFADIPDPELIIRTSGEIRVSNFLLWQGAYSEFLPVDKFWPDFRYDDMVDAIRSYQERDRRFGGLSK
ncbi:MAG: isoprenyl transferase [Candidatus Wallbacteria bacterium HGW-Wallbacteria-1]|jgi:undecaprenyl diphosphate synthase|uniref:Isoprenyl transferase n=1 Tax=Candidatus Wallbacteria bacterium HGW-Wallbacteria-1 TaxID=2013854 RepID=A0A2N1PQB9_9BACT|nr:MAG: isoprenyl transferase [Candidatus Wallbacteria bacterium HGW-Wallbacteria-1]